MHYDQDHRFQPIVRAIQHGETPTVSAERISRHTLQGQRETGYCVWGRAHGGDEVGCLFATRSEAEEYIQAANQAA